MQEDKVPVEKQYRLEVRRGGCTSTLLHSASGENCNQHENVLEVRALNDQELADLWLECGGLQTHLTIYEISGEASGESLSVAHEH